MDPHSSYLDAESLQQLQRSTRGTFSGVGIEIGSEEGFIKIISPIDGTPAKKAGLQAGDLIIKLDQESMQGATLNEASKKIRGREGSSITFTILRKGTEKPFDIVVTRESITSTSVRHRIIDDHIGYIRISQFQNNTSEEFSHAISQLNDHENDIIGIILDLRNNPGGVLQSSIQVTDSLLEDGVIVQTKGRLATSNIEYQAEAGDETNNRALIVLVNGGSASASEIVAGALQDHRRAVIMGTRTFGKGSVQTVLPVTEDKGIKLTTARYFTPKGRSIQAQGITPDIIVKPATITELKETKQLSEADLAGHLENTTPPHDAVKDGTINNTKDNQLFEAINLLKGLAILRPGVP